MACKKRKECKICGGTFMMERGCSLEKRCPACRILHPHWPTKKAEINYLPEGIERFKKFYPEQKEDPCYGFFCLDECEDCFIIERFEQESMVEENIELARRILALLSKEERVIIQGILMRDLAYDEIAEKLGLSASKVAQIEERAIKKLKRDLRFKIIRLVR